MKKGFTLIELLVVIGIISILIAIMIFYFKSTKDKARDALIKETMGVPLTKLSIEYFASHPEGYGSFCNELDFNKTGFLQTIDSPSTPKCHSDNTRWVVCAQLNSLNTKAWCTDNTGVKKAINLEICPPSIHSCQ